MGACKLLSLSLILLLGACRGANPYSADSRPLPPAPVQAAGSFDPSAYPAAPRDFAAYRTWAQDRQPVGAAWASPELLQEMLSGALDQRGLRPARVGSPADLRVAVQLRNERRLRQVRDDYGYGGYYGHGPYQGDRYGMGAHVPLLRTYEEEVMVVDIDLVDGTDGQPVWRGSAETLLPDSQAERADALRAVLQKALADYPPR